jgi:hypothetical protein
MSHLPIHDEKAIGKILTIRSRVTYTAFFMLIGETIMDSRANPPSIQL